MKAESCNVGKAAAVFKESKNNISGSVIPPDRVRVGWGSASSFFQK